MIKWAASDEQLSRRGLDELDVAVAPLAEMPTHRQTRRARIGSCFTEPVDRRQLSTWLSPRDFVSLIKAIFDAPATGHLVVFGASKNRTVWWNNDHASFLGWTPEDSSEQFRAKIEAATPPEARDDPAVIFQGGKFAAVGHFEGEN